MYLKNKIKLLVNEHSLVERILKTVYTWWRKPHFLEKKKSFGDKNEDKIIYIIRPNSEDGIQGLMSLLLQTMRKIDYAKRKGYVPVVDFKNYKTQYWTGKDNAWEFFFQQPSDITLEEAYQSKNVILSGATFFKRENMKLLKKTIFFDNKIIEYCHKLIMDNLRLNKNIIDGVNIEEQNINLDKSIGVYIRGTDYIKLKPIGEYAQPTIDEIITQIEIFLKKYPDFNVFLVTEDKEYYRVLKEKFDKKINIVSFDSFIEREKVNDFLSKTNLLNEDIIQRGREYLIKEILLSKCKCLITSITYGSIAAYAFNGNRYQDKYVFDKGIYK